MDSFDLTNELLPGLPMYKNGTVSNDVYNAGTGRFRPFSDGIAPFGKSPFSADRLWNEKLRHLLPHGVSIERKDEPPCLTVFSIEHEGDRCVLSANGEDKGFEVLAEKTVPDSNPVYVRSVTDTDEAAFNEYIDRLSGIGINVVYKRETSAVIYCELKADNAQICACYFRHSRIARFALDSVSVPICDFGSGINGSDGTMQICQFSLTYDKMVHGVSADCGMLYLVKLPDDSLFLVDGGEYEQATDAAAEEVFRLMRKMSKTGSNEKIRVSGWFCTHAHDDHTDMFAKLIRLHHDEIELERVIFNFPSNELFPIMPQALIALKRVNSLYPNVKYLKPHTGQCFEMAGVRFEILYTHEDTFTMPDYRETRDFNETSTVMRISYQGVSFVLLGDICCMASRVLRKNYTKNELHCNMMQAAHHLINHIPLLYSEIGPEIALVPQSEGWRSSEKYKCLNAVLPDERVFFASEYSYVFEIENGELRLIVSLPHVGGLYDGSDI